MNIVRTITKKEGDQKVLSYKIAFDNRIPAKMKNFQSPLLENHLTAPFLPLYPLLEEGSYKVIYQRKSLLLHVHKTNGLILLRNFEPLQIQHESIADYHIDNRMKVTPMY